MLSADRQLVALLPILILLFLSAGLTLLVYAAYTLRRVVALLYETRTDARSITDVALANLFDQVQALHSLYAELDLPQGLPPTRRWAASPDFLLLLTRRVRRTKPALVVECGSGTSTIVLARGRSSLRKRLRRAHRV